MAQTEQKKKSSGTHTYRENAIERVRNAFLNTTTFSQYTRQSVNWFKNYVGNHFPLRITNARNYLTDKVSNPVPGNMYMYSYDPKTKEQLDYYDTFPLIICLEVYKDGFLGLNLHYVDPQMRAVILLELLTITNNRNYDEKTKFAITYQKLQSLSKMKSVSQHMLKRYLYTQLKTPISKVKPDDWEIVIFLPLQNFKKAYSSQVWKDAYR